MRDVRLLIHRALALAHQVAETTLAPDPECGECSRTLGDVAELAIAPLARVACISSALLSGNATALAHVPAQVAAASVDVRRLRTGLGALGTAHPGCHAARRLHAQFAALEEAFQRLCALVGCSAASGTQPHSSRTMIA